MRIFSSLESKWLVALIVLAGCAALTPIACAQIIGADKDRVLASDAASAAEAAATSVNTNTVPPCAADQKRCSGACVAIDDAQFGCTTSDCDPCDVPYAATEKCNAGACAVATCTPGRADCNGQGSDGCEADLGAAATCGGCATACGGAVGPYCTPSGQCVSVCPSGLALCGTACRLLTDSADNCGSCGNICTVPAGSHSTPACSGNACGFTCDNSFGDCDGNRTNGCEAALQLYYADADHDGFGAMSSTSTGSGCVPAPIGSATNAFDCLDTGSLAAQVHPKQTGFFTSPYTAPSGPSFDYDCDGKETASAAFKLGGSCTPCTVGYIQVSGAKYANAYCGSTQEDMCTVGSSIVCSTDSETAVGCN